MYVKILWAIWPWKKNKIRSRRGRPPFSLESFGAFLIIRFKRLASLCWIEIEVKEMTGKCRYFIQAPGGSTPLKSHDQPRKTVENQSCILKTTPWKQRQYLTSSQDRFSWCRLYGLSFFVNSSTAYLCWQIITPWAPEHILLSLVIIAGLRAHEAWGNWR